LDPTFNFLQQMKSSSRWATKQWSSPWNKAYQTYCFTWIHKRDPSRFPRKPLCLQRGSDARTCSSEWSVSQSFVERHLLWRLRNFHPIYTPVRYSSLPLIQTVKQEASPLFLLNTSWVWVFASYLRQFWSISSWTKETSYLATFLCKWKKPFCIQFTTFVNKGQARSQRVNFSIHVRC